MGASGKKIADPRNNVGFKLRLRSWGIDLTISLSTENNNGMLARPFEFSHYFQALRAKVTY